MLSICARHCVLWSIGRCANGCRTRTSHSSPRFPKSRSPTALPPMLKPSVRSAHSREYLGTWGISNGAQPGLFTGTCEGPRCDASGPEKGYTPHARVQQGFLRLLVRAQSALVQRSHHKRRNCAISGARFKRAREVVMASYIKRTIRLNPSQARTLSGFANRRGLSEYALLLKVIDAGFLALLHGTDRETDLAEMASVIGSISERLAERGTSREEASAAEKQIAALDTREAKSHADHKSLRADWRATAEAKGFGEAAQARAIAEAKERARAGELAASPEILAARAVAWAAAKLSERQAVFPASTLAREAGDYAFGRLSHNAISAAIAEAGERGALVPRAYLDRRGAESAGFTTPEAIATEQAMLRLEAAGRGVSVPLASSLAAARTVERAARQSARAGFAWTDDQKRATSALLTSRDRVAAVQGYAGTAKTTTVLATYAREAAKSGLTVTALAPTASAATVLGEALGLRGDTVARHLVSPEAKGLGKGAVWIVDEASMLSARDMAALMASADKAGARLVLVGDVRQLGSVGAGAAFAQLQQAGMATAKLANVVRQTNADTREAVMASIEGHAGKALAALERGGGDVIEGASRDARLATMAQRYVALSPTERVRTLVIEPSRDGRDTLTAMIRQQLVQRGELSSAAVRFEALEAKGLTRAETRQAASYAIGDVVRFARDYADKGVTRGSAYRVERIDPDKAAVALKAADGSSVDWRLRQWGAGKVEVFEC
ncbi:hypothetical protein FA702_06405 [Novosphingobium sp. EMRT-2]|nr:hypothetical protein FA702_06405 [Novosphingobium sp. EMRT-2]